MSVFVVGIGGSMGGDSQSERALGVALSAARDAGAVVQGITGAALALPFYDQSMTERSAEAKQLVETLRAADGVVLASPGYHGTVSGLVKNALDYVEDLASDDPPYLDGRAIGCIASARGWQASVTTLETLRSIAHAVRGWPTPLGVAVNSSEQRLDVDGGCPADIERKLRTVGRQVVEFASLS